MAPTLVPAASDRRHPVPPQHALLDSLVVTVSKHASEHLMGVATRLVAGLLDITDPSVEARAVYQRVKSGNLLKNNSYAFFHLVVTGLETALRKEIALLLPAKISLAPTEALSLVPYEEMDSKVAFGALSRPFEIAYSDALATLNVRLGFLLERDILRIGQNPFRPEVFLMAINDAWCAFEPDADAHALLLPLLKPAVLFDFAPLFETLNLALMRKGVLPGSVDSLRIRKTDNAAAAAAKRATGQAALSQQLRQFFSSNDAAADSAIPLIPDLPNLPQGAGGWRPSGAQAFQGQAAAAARGAAGVAPGAGQAGHVGQAGHGVPAGYGGHGGQAGHSGQGGHGVHGGTAPGQHAVAGHGLPPGPGGVRGGHAGGVEHGHAASGSQWSPQGAPSLVDSADIYGEHGAHADFAVGGGVHRGGVTNQIVRRPDSAAATGALVDLLGKLQQRVPQGASAPAGGPASSPGGTPPQNVFYLPRLKESIPQGTLTRGDEGTIDLLSRIFETVFLDDNIPAETRTLIQALQIPVLKAALLDKDFFFQEAHPARRMIDLMSRMGWEQRQGADDPMFQAMQRGVDRVGRDYDKEIKPFAEAVAELEASLQAEESTAAAAIAEPIAQALKQEKVTAATRSARNAVALRVGKGEVVAVVEAFLANKWTSVLTVAYSVEDDKPGAVGNATKTMDELIWSVKPKLTSEQRRELIGKLPGLLSQLNKWLDVIKWQDAARLQFFSELAECHASIVRAPLELSPERQLAIAVEVAQQDALRRIEKENALARQDDAVAADPAVVALDSFERGMWLEFTEADGSTRKVKLAWISPLRTLFIFSTGARQEAFSTSAEKLAELYRAERMRVIRAEGVVALALSAAMEHAAVNDPSMQAASVG
jgi:hypothetical protein